MTQLLVGLSRSVAQQVVHCEQLLNLQQLRLNYQADTLYLFCPAGSETLLRVQWVVDAQHVGDFGEGDGGEQFEA